MSGLKIVKIDFEINLVKIELFLRIISYNCDETYFYFEVLEFAKKKILLLFFTIAFFLVVIFGKYLNSEGLQILHKVE